jgi:hypothetical protein
VKYGGTEDWHDWIKMHLMCGVKTHIVTSVEISRATANDSPFYKPLLAATAKAGFKMQEVSADKGYTSMKNLQTTVDHGAIPYIPFSQMYMQIAALMYGLRCFTSTTSNVRNSWPTITSGQTWKASFR